ncbi:MAG: hypothetical protein JXR60_02910 [Bacteroidales bacterium]|nr:hypothetical protein [Bacteroidales bacterium]
MRYFITLVFIITLFSCQSGSSHSSVEERMALMEQEICDCFEKYQNEPDKKIKCFELQDYYWHEINDSILQIQFTKATYQCLN